MIDRFKGKHAFLSNFHMCAVAYDGMVYPSAEHAYQAAKSTDKFERAWVREAPTAAQAKKRGRRVKNLHPDWNKVKVDVMLAIIRSKFTDAQLRAQLMATGNQRLVEGNTWGDVFWGVCGGKGENHLGRILVRVRHEITFAALEVHCDDGENE
jgi:ribA/ribD-fused uncharacterized protein